MRFNSTAVSIVFADDCQRNLRSGLREILNFLNCFFIILRYSRPFYDVLVLLVHHISALQEGAHLKIPLTLSLACCKRRLKGTVGVIREK